MLDNKAKTCAKCLKELKNAISVSQDTEEKFADIKKLLIDILEALVQNNINPEAIKKDCKELKDIAREYNDESENLIVKKAARDFSAIIGGILPSDYQIFVVHLRDEIDEEVINYLAEGPDNNTSSSGSDFYNQAVDAYQREDYVTALSLGMKAMAAGSNAPCYLLGHLYTWGKGIKADAVMAFNYFKQGAEDNQASCQFELYRCYSNGKGVTQNTTIAHQWLQKAANNEDLDAMFVLGNYYCLTTPPRYNEAFKLFEKAAAKGSNEAAAWVGRCYEMGYSVSCSTSTAKEIYIKEIAKGNETAKNFYNELIDKEKKEAEKKRQEVADRLRRERIRKEEKKKKRIRNLVVFVILAGIIGFCAYKFSYIPYVIDRDAPRSYVFADNLFMRSSKIADVEHNRVTTLPYGTEVLIYQKDSDGWADAKAMGQKGYIAMDFTLNKDDFQLLNGVWGCKESKEAIATAKCRLAVLDFLKKDTLYTGPSEWQIFTYLLEIKPNNVFYPRLANGLDKFTEFAFIIKNNTTNKRLLALYAFTDDEKPVLCYQEEAPADGEIKNIIYSRNKYRVIYNKK